MAGAWKAKRKEAITIYENISQVDETKSGFYLTQLVFGVKLKRNNRDVLHTNAKSMRNKAEEVKLLKLLCMKPDILLTET